MRGLRPFVVVVCSFVVAIPVLPAAAGGTEVTGSNERGVFVNAGWDLVDPVTGTDRYLVVEASGPAGSRATGTLVSVFGSAYRVVECDGEEALWVRDVGGEGTGTITIAPRLTSGTLHASLDLTIRTMDPCTGTATERVRHDVPVRLALLPAGSVRRESSGWSQLLPSVGNAHTHVNVKVRSAVGRVVVGSSSERSGWAEFGRIHGVWHVSSRTDAPTIVARIAAIDAVATRHVRQWFAGAADERYGRDRARVIEVDALRSSDRTVMVFVTARWARTVTCADGSRSTVESALLGEGPGEVRFGVHLGAASASATLDLTRVVSDGCTGLGSETVRRAVPVTLDVAADGPLVTTREWVAIRVPSETNERVWIEVRGRSASGAFTVGDVRYEPTTWGAIWKYRDRARLEPPEEA